MANLKNFATALVQTAPSPATSGTTLVVETGKGVRFPTPPFYATAHPANAFPTLDNAEVVYVTAISTDTLTITRAQKGTTAQTIVGGGTTWRISNTIFVEDIASTMTLVTNELPVGSINGVNMAFTTASTYATGTLQVFLNGQRLRAGSGNDYVETTQGFTMQYAPETGSILLVDYYVTNSVFVQGSNSTIANETPTGSVNSSNALFTVLQGKYLANSLEVFLDGIQQVRGVDYTETNPSIGTFTFTVAPLTSEVVRVNYQFSTGASGNADTVDGYHGIDLMPIGAGMDYFGSTVPSSLWLFAAGQAVSRTTYAALFSIIGTTYGAGDGSTTFNVPDKRGRTSAGADAMGGTAANRLGSGASGGITGSATLGATGGAQTHTITDAELSSTVSNKSSTSIQAYGTGTASGYPMSNLGTSTPMNIVSPVIVTNYIIKAL